MTPAKGEMSGNGDEPFSRRLWHYLRARFGCYRRLPFGTRTAHVLFHRSMALTDRVNNTRIPQTYAGRTHAKKTLGRRLEDVTFAEIPVTYPAPRCTVARPGERYPQTPSNSRHSPLLIPLVSWVTTSPASRRFTTATAFPDRFIPPIR